MRKGLGGDLLVRVAPLWLLQVGETWGPDAEDHSKPPRFASGWGAGSGAHNPFSHKGKGGLGERGKLQTSTLGACTYHGCALSFLRTRKAFPHPMLFVLTPPLLTPPLVCSLAWIVQRF